MKIEKVSEENLKKIFQARISAEEITERVQSYIAEKAKTVKIDGFRPGKAPLDKVRSYYEGSAVSKSLSAFVEEIEEQLKDLIPEGLSVKPTFDAGKGYQEGQDLVINLTAYAKPFFELCDLSTIEINDFQFKVPEEEVSKKMELIAQEKDVKRIRSTDHLIEEQDRTVIRMSATYGKKKVVKGYNTQRGALTIDAGNKDQTFLIDHLRGKKTGDHLTFTETFSHDYADTRLAGKEVSFDIHILEVYHFVKLPIGEELAKELGFESLEIWQKSVQEDAESHYRSFSNLCKRRALLDALSEKHAFDIPDILVDHEFESIWAQLEEEEKNGGTEGKTPDEIKEECKTLAHRRVRLGFIVTKLGEALNIKVYQNDVENAIWREAIRAYHRFGQDAHKIVANHYKENQNAYNQLISVILEEKVVTALLERVTMKPSSVSLLELKASVDTILPEFWEDFNASENIASQEDCQHHEGCGHQH